MPKQRNLNRRSIAARRTVRRAIKHMRSKPLAKVRAKPTVRSASGVSTTVNNLRNFKLIAPKIKTDNTITDKWWIQTIKYFGLLLFKYLATAVSASDLRRHLERYPLPADHPLHGNVLTSSYVTGTIIRTMIGAEDLLGDSLFVVPEATATIESPKGICKFRQARIEWVKITITPTPTNTQKEGMVLAGLRSIPLDEAQQDFINADSLTFTWNEMMRIPGIVYKTALTSTLLSWSPRPGEFGYEWQTIGDPKTSPTFGTGGAPCIYFDFGFQNWTSTNGSADSEYSIASALFDVVIESRVHLREYDDRVTVRIKPWVLTKADTIGVAEYNKHQFDVPIEQCHEHHGMLLHATDLNQMAI